MPYTLRDTPETVARIEADLALVRRAVAEADPGLRALVLTGGFARGEGAMLDGEPQNDYDLVAIRGGRTATAYAPLRDRLSALVGLHVDLAPVAAWRLRWAPPSIFWYETALRGRVLWGPHGGELLAKIPTRDPARIARTEALRLLANRAAGLLLATDGQYEARLQAAKALLAAMDVHLLAAGVFPPSQRERWAAFQAMAARRDAPPGLAARADWLAWAFTLKVDPANAAAREEGEAWAAARSAVLAAVPVALRHAGLPSLEAFARSQGPVDRFVDRLVYLRRSKSVPGARRLASRPGPRVRIATLRLLEAAADGLPPDDAARELLAPLARPARRPIQTLQLLRQATLQ